MNMRIEGYDKIHQFYLILTHNSLPQTRVIFNQRGMHLIYNLKGFVEEQYLEKGATYILYRDFLDSTSHLSSQVVEEIQLKNNQLSSMGLYLDSKPLIQCLKIIKSSIKSISIKFSYVKLELSPRIQLMMRLTAELQEGCFELEQMIETQQNWKKIDEFCREIELEQNKSYYPLMSLSEQTMSQITSFVRNLSFELILDPEEVSVVPVFSKDNSIMSISKRQLKEYDPVSFSQVFKRESETMFVDGDLNRLLNLQEKLRVKSRISVQVKEERYFMRVESDSEGDFVLVGKQAVSLRNEEQRQDTEEDEDHWEIEDVERSMNEVNLHEEKKNTEECKYWKEEPRLFKKC